jgi:hypothetical protein
VRLLLGALRVGSTPWHHPALARLCLRARTPFQYTHTHTHTYTHTHTHTQARIHTWNAAYNVTTFSCVRLACRLTSLQVRRGGSAY